VVAAHLDIGLEVTTALHVVRADLPLVPVYHNPHRMHMAIRAWSSTAERRNSSCLITPHADGST
jgi:hypothetical protein